MIGNLFEDDERAVSPVIGVILMVAITVILAAVIGTFVLNLGGSVSQNVQAGASVQTTADNEVKVTWTSNQNADDLDVKVSGCMDAGTSFTQVGQSWTSSTGGACTDDQTASVIVTANSADSSTVILNKEVEF